MAKKTKNFTFVKGAAATSIKSIKYTATELTIDRMPFTSNTVTNSINMAKDLREWTRRNNPFKAVNGNKDPLVRQIATASMKGLRAAKQDLMHGDLRFSRLNKEFRAFVGGEDPEHAFDFMDADFGDADFSAWDSGDGNEDRTTVAVGESISREFTDTQMASTSAMIGAVETATDRVATISLKASEVATDRLIAANLTNMSRLSTQIGQATGELTTVNQNLSLLVQQGNDVNQFLGQSQKFMENTEQSLNDIKSLLQTLAAPHQESQSRRDVTPEWLENGFDPKGYLKDKMSNTMTGMIVSAGVSKVFKALKLEIPSFIDQTMPSNFSDLKPLNAAFSKILPAINRFGTVDKMIEGAFKTVLAKIEEGEYTTNTWFGTLIRSAGLDGWGYNPNGRRKVFNSANYNKGTIAWNGKSERALQEVIPSYLSNIEGYVKSIAEGLDADRAERKGTKPGIDTSQFRLYDYEGGAFTNMVKLRKAAQEAYNDAAQSAFYDVMAKIEDNVNGGTQFNTEISKVFNDMLKDETQVSSKENIAEFKRVLQKYRKDGKLSDGEIMILVDQLTREVKPAAVRNLSELRKSANDRSSAFYHLGDTELWKLKADVQFKTKADIENDKRNKIIEAYANNPQLQAEQLREYDKKQQKIKREEEAKKNGRLKKKLKSTETGALMFDLWDDLKKHGGVLNRSIEYVQDYGIINPLLSLVHGLKGFDEGTGINGLESDQVIAAHKGEIIFTKEQSDFLRKVVQPFNEVQRKWGSNVRMNMRGEVYNDTSSKKKQKQKIHRRKPANEAERNFMSETRNENVEKAQTAEEETLERTREMSDNIASIAANVMSSTQDNEEEKRKNNNSEAFNKVFGEADENGFYQGKWFSGLANMTVDFKNMMRHAVTGEAYTTSAGVKVAKTDDCLNGSLGSSLKKAGDAAARTLFGDDYKDSKTYKSVKGGFSDFFAGLKATAAGETVDDEFWANKHAEDEKHQYDDIVKFDVNRYSKMDDAHRSRYDKLLAFKKQKFEDNLNLYQYSYDETQDPKTAEKISQVQNEIGRISRKIEWIDKFNSFGKEGKEDSEAAKAANKALFGVEDIGDFGSNVAKATQETSNEAHNKLVRGFKFGIGGAISLPLVKAMGLGAIPSFFLPGGPIGGAILGVATGILSKNKTFMAHLFGGEDKDGNKIDGIISKDLQEKFKTASQKILGPATIGAVGGLIFPKAVGTVSHALGPVLGGLIGTGPIGGAVIASGAALMLGSEKVKEKLFGRDEEGNATGIINKGIANGKRFLTDNKDALKRLGMGAIGGALLGTKVFGLSGLVLAPTILGSAIGISTLSSKFTDYLFGTKMMKKDEHGNTIWTRDGDGLIGRVGRMISLKLLTPVKSFVSNGADRVMEYIRHDIGFSIKSILSPLTVPLKDVTDNLAESFKKIGDKATKLAKKFFDPLLKISGGIISGLTKFSLGLTKFSTKIIGGIVSAPLKMLGGIGNLFTKKNSKELKQYNREFRWGYTDENGKLQSGWLDKLITPTAWLNRIAKKTNTKGIKNKVSGFFEAINPFAAYSEERMNFAKKRGLTNNAAFMANTLGGLLGGAESNRHKTEMKRISKQEALDRELQSLANEYAKKDHGNNKIQLNKRTLDQRNTKIREAYARANLSYTNMTNDQMMKFIYDPLGKHGENKQRMIENEEKRHAEMKGIVGKIQNRVSEIADILTGRKRPLTDAEREERKRKAYEKKQRKKMTQEEAFKAAAKDPNAPGVNLDDLSFGQRMAIAWQKYQDWFVDKTVGRVKRGAEKVKDGWTNLKTNVGNAVDSAKYNIEEFGNRVKTTASNINRGVKKGAKAVKMGVGAAWDWMTRDREPEKEKKRKLKREYATYKAVYKNRKTKLRKLLRDAENGKDINISAEEAESLGLDPSRDLNEQVKSKAGEIRGMKKLSRRAYGKAGSMEVALKATKGSLMEMLTKKKSVLVGLGTVAIGALVTTVAVKFPKIIDWFKDKAIPFIKDTVWPFIKGAFEAVGKLLCGIGDFVRGGRKAVTKFLNFTKSGTWEDPETKEAKDQLNAENGLLNDDEMKAYVQNNANVANIAGKTARDKLDRVDYLAAALAYAGQMLRSDRGSANDVTADDILTYVKSTNKENGRSGFSVSWMTNSVYNKILNKCAPDELAKGHSRWQNASANDLRQAALMAAQYLNNDRAAAAQLIEQNLNQGLAADETSVGAGHFMQTDPRWRNRRYANSNNGFSTIGNGGCGPTALANVAVQNGIRTNPVRVATMAQNSGYTAQGGTNAKLFNEGARRLGLNSTAIGRNGIKRALANGKSVIFAGKGHGFYTGAGHIMSARGLDRHGNAIVDDPLRKRAISVPMSKIGNGLTNAWSIGRGEDPSGSATTINGDIDSSKTTTTAAYMMAKYGYNPGLSQQAVKDANTSSTETSSTKTKSYGEYMNALYAQDDPESNELRSSMYNYMRRDSITIPINSEGWNAAYYAQVDPAWKNIQLKYTSGTIGDDGCVISSMGGLLANITGLNYRPDVVDSIGATYYKSAGLQGMLKSILPPSLQGKGVYRLKIRHPENIATDEDNSKFSFGGVSVENPDLRITKITKETEGKKQKKYSYRTVVGSPDMLNSAEKIFTKNVLTQPFILYGGSKYRGTFGKETPNLFRTANNPNATYYTHAVLVIPSAQNVTQNYKSSNKKDLPNIKYYVFNPGTGQATVDESGFRTGINTGETFTFDELFSKRQGIESMFVIDDAVPDIKHLATYAKNGKTTKRDAIWFSSIFDQSAQEAGDYASSSAAANNQSTSADVAARAAEIAGQNSSSNSSDSNSDSFLTKIASAMGELGKIAANLFGAVFSGKYKSIYSNTETAYSTDGSSSTSYDSSGSSSSATWEYTMEDRINDYIENNAWAKNTAKSGNPELIRKMRSDIEQMISSPSSVDTSAIVASLAPTDMMQYSALPDYSKNFAGKLTLPNDISKGVTSSRLSADEINNIEEAMSRLAWEHENHGDYANIIDNDISGISVGIGGFHNANAMELLLRMKNSNKYTGQDAKDLNDIINNGFVINNGVYTLRAEYKSTLARLLDTEVSHRCQDAMVHQEHMSALIDLLQEYDYTDASGVHTFDDVRSLIALGQFQGYGQYYIPGMMGHGKYQLREGFPDAFRNRSYDKTEELANTIKAANAYYSKVATYSTGHKNRFKSVYSELGGTETNLGFGGGIRDSYNTYGYYDSVDTPVAINSDNKVMIEDRPITSRLDTIIEYMRRIIAMGSSVSQASTARDNLDIGRGLANDMKMRNAGLERKETIPVYKKDENYVDKMRVIHNKIARSPRTV